MSSFPRGSEWRKWDLHLHTPKSIIQHYGGDNKTAWDQFIQKIASLPPEVKVIGVTDYLFCDGYEYLLNRKSEIPNIQLIIPNIEFRLNTFSGTEGNTKRHNFHVLFDPLVSVDDIRDQLLNGLSTGYNIQDDSEWQQTPTVRSLTQLGNQMKAAAPSDNSIQRKSDLEVGFDNITYRREDILKLLEKDCFKGKYVTAVGYSEWDQSRWDQSAAEKRTLINSSDFCLTSLEDPEKISNNRANLKANNLNSLVLHSSDSHELDKVGKTLQWVKADPIFAGIKQLLNEPESRLFIGDLPPNYKPEHKVISEVSISNSNGWFEDSFKLELNRDLITLIGGRGSGKSALAEAIAYGAGSLDNTEDSFLKKANQHKSPIKGAKVKLTWADGTLTEHEIGTLTYDHELVRYLPQGAVEELCSPRNSEKLQKQIENVIFQALDETERMGASDFDELRTRILNNFQYEKDQVVKKLKEINHQLSNVVSQLRSKPEKQKLLDEKKLELIRLNESLPVLPQEDKRQQEELAKLIELKRKFESKIILLQGDLNNIGEIEAKVKVFKTRISDFKQDITVSLASLGISQDVFKVELDEGVIAKALEDKKIAINNEVKVLKSGSKQEVTVSLGLSETELVFANLSTLNVGITQKQNNTRSFETTKLKYQQQKDTIAKLEDSIKALKAEIEKINTNITPMQNRLENDRLQTYYSYFELLAMEKNETEKLYKPLQESLADGTETDKKLVFEARIDYRTKAHAMDGLSILDRSRKGNFRDAETLHKTLDNFWETCVNAGLGDEVLKSSMGKILQAFHNFEENEITIEEQLRDNYTYEDFYNWLFNPTYFETVSSLKFNGTDLYLLSPGQKGIILLMLYLEVDKADYRPLIIDQPEENLDNLSVYKDLIGYFRERKRYRQIIMVTHNPNLVVNTDAEQIIVADYSGARTPRLCYESGSLEDHAMEGTAGEDFEVGIIEQVCDILEGGEEAFEKRKSKYRL